MVNLIKDKISNPYSVSYNNSTYRQQSVQELQKSKTTEHPVKKFDNWKDALAPLGLIAGGGILLYYGVKTPGKITVFKNYVKNRKFEMSAQLSAYNTFVKNTVESYFKDISAYIQSYKKQAFVSPASFLSHIKMLDDPKAVSKANDLTFAAIARSDMETTRAGASDIGNFSVKIDKIVRASSSAVEHKKEKTKQIINDYVHLPKFKDGKYSDIVESSEDDLINMAAYISKQMDSLTSAKINSTVRESYLHMANMITEARKLRTEAKKNAINVTFEHISSLLKLDNFKPLYAGIPAKEEISKLTPDQLKPSVIPHGLQEVLSHNIYLQAVKSKDFNNLTKTDLNEIFYRAPYNNSLKDLGFLIDRLRIKQEIAKAASESANVDSYGVLIAKLGYLANRLQEFGTEELINKCQKDFHKMTVEQRRAALYYVSTVSRRLGFDSIKEMDEYFSRNNEIYMNLNIRDYMDIFAKSPELYFI